MAAGEDYRHGGWAFEVERGPEGDKFKLDELQEAEAQLFRVTYEGFAAGSATLVKALITKLTKWL